MHVARVLPLVGLVAFAASSGGSAVPRPIPHRVDVAIDGQFAHFVPTVINASYGDTIHVTLKAMDSAHGFRVAGKDFDITAYPGLPAEITFVADWVGGREWFCTFDCGPQHGQMSGMVVVKRRV